MADKNDVPIDRSINYRKRKRTLNLVPSTHVNKENRRSFTETDLSFSIFLKREVPLLTFDPNYLVRHDAFFVNSRFVVTKIHSFVFLDTWIFIDPLLLFGIKSIYLKFKIT